MHTGKLIVGTTMSLDGFINDRQGSVDALYPNLEALRETEFLQESIRTTGAVIMGRHAYDMAAGDLTGYEYQVPIFVLTHHPPATPPKGQNANLRVTFVTEGVGHAVAQARAAAGARDVQVVGGAATAQQILAAGLADELLIGIVPALLGGGLRFFPPGGLESLALEHIETIESPGRTDLRFRIRH